MNGERVTMRPYTSEIAIPAGQVGENILSGSEASANDKQRAHAEQVMTRNESLEGRALEIRPR